MKYTQFLNFDIKILRFSKYFKTKLSLSRYESQILRIPKYSKIKKSNRTNYFKTMKKSISAVRTKSKHYGENLARYVIKHRWLVLIASILTVFIAGYGAKNMGFNSDYHVFFSDENPQLLAYDALQNKYSKDDNAFIVLSPKNKDVFTKENLAAIQELVDASWKTPHSSRVDAITNFQYTKAEGDDLYVEDLVGDLQNYNQQQLTEVKNIATSDIRLKNRLVNAEGTITAVNITVKLSDIGDPKENENVVKYVREMLADFQEKHPQFEIHTSGMVMLNNAFQEASSKDMSTLTPLMFLVILITILLFTRTFSGTFATLIVIVFSLVTAMGIGGWIGIQLTPPSSAFLNIIMTLAVADSIHVIVTFIQTMKSGTEKREAIIESLKVNFLPVFITSLTTVIGFLSMNFSDSPPFHDLGNLTSIGMTAAFLFSITTLPALLAILPVKVKKSHQIKSAIPGFMERLSEFVIRQKRALVIGSTSIIVISSIFIFNNDLNDEFIKYFSSNVEFRQDTDFISENLTGIYTIEYSLSAGEAGGINNPTYLQKLQEFEDWLYTHDEVIHVNSFAEVSKQINKSMHGDDLAYYKIPDNREEAAQYLLLYEMSLPFGLDLNNQINVDKSETRVIVTTKNVPTKRMIALEDASNEWLINNTPEYMHAEGVSSTMMFSHLTQRQINSMIKGTIFAILLISLILGFSIKSLRYGLISLIPNLTPLIVGLGIWGLFVGYINTGISIVFGMTLGIIVDDTVHFLTKYLRARRKLGYSAEDSIRYAFKTVGQALLITTFVLVMGFLIIAQSDFGLNSGMAKITILIIAIALVLDFLLLPALLLMFNRNKNSKSETTEEAEVIAA